MKKVSFKTLVPIIGLIGFTYSSNAQSEAKYSIGENLSNFSIAKSDADYVVAGTITYAAGGRDFKIIKFDLNGNIIWNKAVDIRHADRAHHIQKVSSGYAITGFARGNAPSDRNELVLLVLDNNGNTVLEKTYSDLGRPNDGLIGLHVLELNNNKGYLISGYLKEPSNTLVPDKSALVMNVDQTGNINWAHYYDTPNTGDSDFDMASFALKLDGDFYVTGSANIYKSNGQTNQAALSMRISASGSVLWMNNFAFDLNGQFDQNLDVGTSAVARDGVISLSSNTSLNHSFNISKIDENTGLVSNHVNFIPIQESNTASFSLGINPDGDYVIGGMIAQSGTDYSGSTILQMGSVSFVCEISKDLNTVNAAEKYLMYNANFQTDEGLSTYNSHFGGSFYALNNPVIATPEMLYVNPDSDEVALLAYEENQGSSGSYNLQYIRTSSSSNYSWCSTRNLEFDPNPVSAIYDKSNTITIIDDMDITDGVTITDIIDIESNCQEAGKKETENTVNTETLNTVGAITVFPNPAGEEISIDGLTNGEEVLILNAAGQIVESHITNGNTLQISRNGKATGIYFVKVVGRTTKNTIKFIFD